MRAPGCDEERQIQVGASSCFRSKKSLSISKYPNKIKWRVESRPFGALSRRRLPLYQMLLLHQVRVKSTKRVAFHRRTNKISYLDTRHRKCILDLIQTFNLDKSGRFFNHPSENYECKSERKENLLICDTVEMNDDIIRF